MEKGYKKLKKESDHENLLIVIWKEINGAVFSFFICFFFFLFRVSLIFIHVTVLKKCSLFYPS